MQTVKQVLESCVRWGVIAEYTVMDLGSAKASGAYCKFVALQKVLELPYSKQCKGLSVEEVEDFCKSLANKAWSSNKNLQVIFKEMNLKELENKLK